MAIEVRGGTGAGGRIISSHGAGMARRRAALSPQALASLTASQRAEKERERLALLEEQRQLERTQDITRQKEIEEQRQDEEFRRQNIAEAALLGREDIAAEQQAAQQEAAEKQFGRRKELAATAFERQKELGALGAQRQREFAETQRAAELEQKEKEFTLQQKLRLRKIDEEKASIEQALAKGTITKEQAQEAMRIKDLERSGIKPFKQKRAEKVREVSVGDRIKVEKQVREDLTEKDNLGQITKTPTQDEIEKEADRRLQRFGFGVGAEEGRGTLVDQEGAVPPPAVEGEVAPKPEPEQPLVADQVVPQAQQTQPMAPIEEVVSKVERAFGSDSMESQIMLKFKDELASAKTNKETAEISKRFRRKFQDMTGEDIFTGEEISYDPVLKKFVPKQEAIVNEQRRAQLRKSKKRKKRQEAIATSKTKQFFTRLDEREKKRKGKRNS